MDFHLPISSLCDVTIRKEWGMYDHIPLDELKPEQLFTILKGEDRCSSIHTEDHPDFAELRNKLEEQGYIRTQRNCWNGDRVLRPFRLNGALFTEGEKFCSGAAIKWDVEQKLKKKNYRTI